MPKEQILSTLARTKSKAANNGGHTVLDNDKNRFAKITLSQQKQLLNKRHKLLIQPVKTADWRDRI